ncbi:hypothetical protein GUJ93_ZPchr2169g6451 [Zizania palustris]|uniref:PWWP domain-containing protein n=1 Tax=Zizania palustris TaxID=103762 RepID=A0A8J5RCE7_ZIZPA|nr:hypothetical protein GUJ93_ZPchr2169g6451 [Zizania palustris]
MSTHIDLNSAADPQTLAPTQRGRGRPRKNPPPAPDPLVAASGTGPFASGDLVWGKKLAHPAWPGQVISAAATGSQFLVSFFGDKALAWCDATQLRPYEPYFPVGKLYDGEADDFDSALDASLHEFSRRVEATLTAPVPSTSIAHPFLPRDFVALLQDLAADRMGFSNRVQAAVAKAHLRAFDRFRGLPDPPEYTLELGLPSAVIDKGVAQAALLNNCNSATPSRRRGMKRKEEETGDDSDEDWDPRKKGGTGSDSEVDLERKKGSKGGRGSAARCGRHRKTDAGKIKGEKVQDIMEYPPAAEMFLQLKKVAADPLNFKSYGSVPIILSFFSKYKDSEAPSLYDNKELMDTLGDKKDGPAILILHFSSEEAIPYVDDINSIFRLHGPIMEGATEITKKSKIARVVFLSELMLNGHTVAKLYMPPFGGKCIMKTGAKGAYA